ncbi:PREDICTED: ubiquitin carboxyl-terminal hydrolase 28-like [Cyprinodon variegatus]|uniref:ubiquitin carboxyl-terminal hydrolase 28-like n=1 Tax=Cyprinodon variegatus TaxID=28743 RepID=UPI0007427C73|nr:PREDICTED: ubiquitin carboxyl-terminal hydrolase 28-like [Cyprinodon variegatus]
MRTEQSENGENSTKSLKMLMEQLKEITGVQDQQVLFKALKASQGDVGHAVGLLTTQNVEIQDSAEPQESGTSAETWDSKRGLPKDELQTAIELSLQESHNAEQEEREFNRALEASAEENAVRMKRKRCEAQSEMCSPADWIRQDDWPVGIRNVGNTCWFSAVIQDVSEFSHKLLDWLEDAFQLAANGTNAEDKQQNPLVQLFYGTFVTERRHEGKTLYNIEQFGQYPLQVNGFNNLDECLEGAMVEKEIESLHSDHVATSGRERWFKKLPPVLTFELSRFEFNTQLGRPEKIHKKLEFPQIVYMDRYLHKNIEQTNERRGEVKKLKEQLAVFQQKLECYKNYGSGPMKYPLADMLQFVLEFASTRPTSVSPAEDPRLASSSPTPANPPVSEAVAKDISESGDKDVSDDLFSSVSSCQQTPIYKPFTQCKHPSDCPPHPAPHSATEEELHFVKTCLRRWRTEVEHDINELKTSIDKLTQTLEGMYSDNSLCQVPYRLHAVLVHEGQASAGHYWAYIYDHANQRWMKYNDVSITESSWEELERDSFGGMTNASAYCLMYIDDRLPQLITEDTDDETGQVLHGMDSLPAALRRFVQEDNRWFQRELSEWEEQFCQTATPQEESATAAEPPSSSVEKTQQTPVEPAPQSGPSTEELDQGAVLGPQSGAEEEKAADCDARATSEAEAPEILPPSASPECRADATDTPAVSDTLESSPKSAELQSQTSGSDAEVSNQEPSGLHVHAEVAGLSSETNDEPGASGEAAGLEADPENEGRHREQEEAPARQRQAENEVSEVEIPNVGRIMVRADADGYNEEMMLTPAMQGVILAIAKARQTFDKEGPEAGLIRAFHEEYSRLYELSQEEITPQEDARLQHALVYFFQNKAPKRVIERTLLEQFTDRNLSFDERFPLRDYKTAPAASQSQWHDDYRDFRTVFVYLLTGLEQYQHGKIREALNYLAHAYETNAVLLGKGDKCGLDKALIALYRRKCLIALNDSASRLFCSGEESKVEEALSIMDEAVIPCLHLMSRDTALSQEDRDAMENIRSHWCCCLGQDMDDSLQVKLSELLPRVLDGSTGTVLLKDPPKVHVNQAHDLCSRLAALMESIHNTTVVTVK